MCKHKAISTKAISDAEKTVFTITTYNKGGGKIGKSAGFFISSQGFSSMPGIYIYKC